MQNIGMRIRELRKNHGDTQQELGERIGLSYGGVAKVERGDRKASIDLLNKVASVYGVSVSYLIGEGAERLNEDWLALIDEVEERGLSPKDVKEIISFLGGKFSS